MHHKLTINMSEASKNEVRISSSTEATIKYNLNKQKFKFIQKF